ncbi:MAG: archaetidylserine decarboxylase [Legionellales bacterium]|nr:archaetidylserine decarboxylase [Legionellales bacterium]
MPRDYFKTLPQFFIPKRALNRFAGWMANLRIIRVKNYLIRDFVQRYEVNMAEACESNPLQYASFNEFFIRRLRPEARPIAAADVVSPVDGSISEIGYLSDGRLLQAKGHTYSVAALLGGDESYAAAFQSGCYATVYLSPKDYHRVHMPIEGHLQEMIYIPGSLFSVQPTTARVIPNLFAKNERLVAIFATKHGLMAMVLVGAAIVGSIGTVWHGDLARGSQIKRFEYPTDSIVLAKAMEMGYFKLGSTVIVLFANHNNPLQWLEHLHAGDSIQLGQPLAEAPIKSDHT